MFYNFHINTNTTNWKTAKIYKAKEQTVLMQVLQVLIKNILKNKLRQEKDIITGHILSERGSPI